jgi:protein involved in polysaccharide export with SLBB domain
MRIRFIGGWLLAWCLCAAFSRVLTAEIGADYKVGALDIIVVDVFNEKELSKEFRVSATGMISYPLLGAIKVVGQTPREIETQLREKLSKDYLVDPYVTVAVKEYRHRTVTVLGEVNRPGAIDLPAEQSMDIVEAISRAGGFTKAASKGKIQITRQAKQLTFDLANLLKKGASEKPLQLEDGDVIYVPQSIL